MQQQNDRLYELAKQRVAEFAGDPLAQMIAGAHVTGNCAICGRGLTDPISLERGIGPECYGKIAPRTASLRRARGRRSSGITGGVMGKEV